MSNIILDLGVFNLTTIRPRGTGTALRNNRTGTTMAATNNNIRININTTCRPTTATRGPPAAPCSP